MSINRDPGATFRDRRAKRRTAMSWNDYYARRKVMNSVLKLARRAPDAPLPFAEIPRAQELFGTPEQPLLALYYRWNLRLLGKLRSTVRAGRRDGRAAARRIGQHRPGRAGVAQHVRGEPHAARRAGRAHRRLPRHADPRAGA